MNYLKSSIFFVCAILLAINNNLALASPSSKSDERHAKESAVSKGPLATKLQERKEKFEERKDFREDLKLSEEQKEKLKGLKTDPNEREATKMKLKTAKEELRGLFESEDATDAQIRAKAKEITDILLSRREQRLDKMIAMRKIFTPQQKKLMRERRANSPKSSGVTDHRNVDPGERDELDAE